MRVQYRYQTLLEERNLVLHFDEPHIYDYPGWPYIIPVVSTNTDENGTIVMTKLPSLSAQSSLTSLLSAGSSPAIGSRKPVVEKSKMHHVVSAADLQTETNSESNSTSNLHRQPTNESDSQSQVNLTEAQQMTSSSKNAVLSKNVSIDNEENGSRTEGRGDETDMDYGAELVAAQIERLSMSLGDLMSKDDAKGDGDASKSGASSPTRSAPDSELVSSMEPSELFSSIDSKVIGSVSKFQGSKSSGSQAASVSTSSTSVSGGAGGGSSSGGASTSSNNGMGIPLMLQQPMKMIPGVLMASAQRRRTKSLEEPVPVESATAAIRKEKAKLKMTKM